MSARKEVFDTILAKLNRPLGDYASAAAAFATDAVLARFAVVELPARNTQGEWPVGDGDVVYFDGNDQEIWFKLQCLPAGKARAVAAGLIAAADYADREARS